MLSRAFLLQPCFLLGVLCCTEQSNKNELKRMLFSANFVLDSGVWSGVACFGTMALGTE